MRPNAGAPGGRAGSAFSAGKVKTEPRGPAGGGHDGRSAWPSGSPPPAPLTADREAREALDDHVLAQLARQLRPDLLDRLALEAVRVDVRLGHQRDLLEPLAQLALGDPRAHVLRLVGGLLLEHAQ